MKAVKFYRVNIVFIFYLWNKKVEEYFPSTANIS